MVLTHIGASKFEAYAVLSGMGAHLDVAAEQTAFIKQKGLDAISLLVSRTFHAWPITKCGGTAVSPVFLVPRRFGLVEWRVLKDEYEGNVENHMGVLLRSLRNQAWEVNSLLLSRNRARLSFSCFHGSSALWTRGGADAQGRVRRKMWKM